MSTSCWSQPKSRMPCGISCVTTWPNSQRRQSRLAHRTLHHHNWYWDNGCDLDINNNYLYMWWCRWHSHSSYRIYNCIDEAWCSTDMIARAVVPAGCCHDFVVGRSTSLIRGESEPSSRNKSVNPCSSFLISAAFMSRQQLHSISHICRMYVVPLPNSGPHTRASRCDMQVMLMLLRCLLVEDDDINSIFFRSYQWTYQVVPCEIHSCYRLHFRFAYIVYAGTPNYNLCFDVVIEFWTLEMCLALRPVHHHYDCR